MDDRFLHEQRQEPPAGFGRSLRARLRQLEDAPEPRGFRLHPALAGALGVAAIAIAFTFPAVRVAAQSALDLFRVRTFTGLEVSEDRIAQLKKLAEGGKDPDELLFEKQEVLQDPGKPEEFPSADLAASVAGLPGLHKPSSLPAGLTLEKAVVTKAGAARMTVRTEWIRSVLQTLGITDVEVPAGFDGQSITVHIPASVKQIYKNGDRMMVIMEGTSPEVALPPGGDLKKLGEVGLRVLGLDANEARRVAASIDWKNTMLIPVPTSAASFSQVDVNGHRGLMIRANGDVTPDGPRKRHTMVMWTEGERVMAIGANVDADEILNVAQTLR